MIPEQKTVKLSDIIFDKSIYPRKEHDPQLVQRYAECLKSIESQSNFISVATDMRLVDGRHRHLAYMTVYLEDHDHEITVYVYPVTNDKDIYKLAAELNSDAGWQMTPEDKCQAAIKLYRDFQETQEEIAKTLKVRKEKVNQWLNTVLEAEREEREEKIWSLWLACRGTHQEIADELDVGRSTVTEFLQKMSVKFQGNDSDVFRSFEPQVYTNWNFPKLTNKTKIFGSVPQEIVDNLLYYFTQPFNVVFDPFGGGGSTIDRCIERKRRYYVSDLTPIPARPDIRQWDITQGLPDDLPVPDLVFLDPPYWRQAQKKYSEKETDLGNVDLDVFLNTMANIAKEVKRKWNNNRPDARLALIIGPYKEDGSYTDLPFLCYGAIDKYLTPDVRIQVPYSTEVHGGKYVKSAKENKEILYLTRDLMVFGP